MKKLMELYQERLEERKQKQRQAVKEYIRKAKVRKIAEKLTPYTDEVLQMVETYGVEETRKIVNVSLGMKIRANMFADVLKLLSEKKEVKS